MSLGPDRRPSAARAPPQGRAGVEARVAAPGRGGRSAREDRLQALDDRLRAVEVAFGKVDQRLGRSPAGRGGEGLADRGLHRPVATRASRSSRGFEVGCDNISRQRMGNDNQRLVAAAACCIWLLTVVALVSGQAEPPHVTELRRAAEQSHADAQANLGTTYADGRGVPQDYGEAVRWWRLAADQGHADAQANLGTTYAFSRGVPQDYGVAARWYRLAAEQGLANAQFNLGVLYADGRGVPQDYGEAVRWWRLAADQGRADAQFNLGFMYFDGRDYGEAARWYRLAADQGRADAQFHLSGMYYNGWGVPQDYIAAHMWANLAAAQGHENARGFRDFLADGMSSGQIAAAQRAAREWRPAFQSQSR